MIEYHSDYEHELANGATPYYRCIHCKRSDLAINGLIENHDPWCKYRIAKENGVEYVPFSTAVLRHQFFEKHSKAAGEQNGNV